jgi:hypothetical protein
MPTMVARLPAMQATTRYIGKCDLQPFDVGWGLDVVDSHVTFAS